MADKEHKKWSDLGVVGKSLRVSKWAGYTAAFFAVSGVAINGGLPAVGGLASSFASATGTGLVSTAQLGFGITTGADWNAVGQASQALGTALTAGMS